MSAAAYRVVVRGLISPRSVESVRVLLESTDDAVWLCSTCRCTRHTLRGVPAKRIDVAVDDRAEDPPAGLVWVGEIGVKRGRYDGAERPRLALHLMRPHDTHQLSAVDLAVSAGAERVDLRLGEWSGSWRRLRWEPVAEDAARIVTWHWRRWYQHLPWDAAREVAGAFSVSAGHSLAEANRAASRALYRASRDAGWRKLTLRERAKLGIAGDAQWCRDEVVLAAQARTRGEAPVVGEATLVASRAQIERVIMSWSPEAYEEAL